MHVGLIEKKVDRPNVLGEEFVVSYLKKKVGAMAPTCVGS